jgi:hypothetical protein
VKDSGAPSIGDLVVALYDEERDISCVGLVTETKGIECKVQWSSESNPIGWWPRQSLKVISPVGRRQKFNALNILLTT